MNLGMNVIVLDINQGAWKLETERGVIMDGDKPEHPAGSRSRNGAVTATLSGCAPSHNLKTNRTITKKKY